MYGFPLVRVWAEASEGDNPWIVVFHSLLFFSSAIAVLGLWLFDCVAGLIHAFSGIRMVTKCYFFGVDSFVGNSVVLYLIHPLF